ncbi:hypothetical protein GWD52_09635 [Enterobacteriaceae bacterium 4M9]|nr:hypothetical protein [Enterobacteriaceae bacterium 4M9]
MYQLKPGTTALVTGARTTAGQSNIGKTVELFGLYHPGEVFINPVNGVRTRLPHNGARPLWLVTGEVVAFGGYEGFAFVRAEYLMPLDKPTRSQERDALSAR